MQVFRGCNWLWIIAVDFFPYCNYTIEIYIFDTKYGNNQFTFKCTVCYVIAATEKEREGMEHGHSIANHCTINCNNLTLLCHLKRWIFRFTSAVTYENSTRFVYALCCCVCVNVSCFSTYDTLNAYGFIFFHWLSRTAIISIDWQFFIAIKIETIVFLRQALNLLAWCAHAYVCVWYE